MTPRIEVVGLGPAGPELVNAETLDLLGGPAPVVLRTGRHPAAEAVPSARTFDHLYEEGETLAGVYRSMADELVAEAVRSGTVVYAVPGSPSVAETSVTEVTRHPAVAAGEVAVRVHPAVSFLDLAWARLGVDPVGAGARLVDGESFAVGAAGQLGPLLVAQCWSQAVLSEIKLAVEAADPPPVTVLSHLGLADEWVGELSWDELDRAIRPDHLTSLWIPRLDAPVAAELVRLDELVRTLRQQCPWDREQTHGSLARHLLEESYEVLEAIDALAAADALAAEPSGSGPGPDPDGPDPDGAARAVAHLEEELGDLLFQVYFHALLATESGRFTLADVARGVHDKLVARHPHVFGGAEAATPAEVMATWEVRKLAEKDRRSVTEGIPAALPALALAAKLQRKALAVGMVLPSAAEEAVRVAEGAGRLSEEAGRMTEEAARLGEPARPGPSPGTDAVSDGPGAAHQFRTADQLGELLFSVVNLARALGVEPETALRTKDAAFRRAVEARG